MKLPFKESHGCAAVLIFLLVETIAREEKVSGRRADALHNPYLFGHGDFDLTAIWDNDPFIVRDDHHMIPLNAMKTKNCRNLALLKFLRGESTTHAINADGHIVELGGDRGFATNARERSHVVLDLSFKIICLEAGYKLTSPEVTVQIDDCTSVNKDSMSMFGTSWRLRHEDLVCLDIMMIQQHN